MDNKVLIAQCQKIGINVKDSALASVSEEERDRILAHLKDSATSTTEASAKQETLAPTREPVKPTGGKVRTIRAPSTARERREDDVPAEVPVAPHVVAEEPDALPPAAEPPVVAAVTPAADRTSPAPAQPPAPKAPAFEPGVPVRPTAPVMDRSMRQLGGSKPAATTSPAKPAAAPSAKASGPLSGVRSGSKMRDAASGIKSTAPETPVAKAAEPPAPETPDAPPADAPPDTNIAASAAPPAATPPAQPAAPAPLRREDYQPASGAVRSMAPRGNMTQIAPPGAARRPKTRPTPQLPKLAEPPPAPKAPAASAQAEAPAQKPEMRLSKDMLEAKPLHEHMRQHTEEKKRKAKDDFTEEYTEEVKHPGAKSGAKAVGTSGAGLLSERKNRQAKRSRTSISEDDDFAGSESERLRQHRIRSRHRHTGPAPAKTSAEISHPITFRSLSLAMGRPVKELMGIMARRGTMPMINMSLDEETALDLAMECGIDLHILRERDIEQELADSTIADESSTTRAVRPPIVTIMGHVDHGKTTLLDKLRSTNVAGGEIGGITQHIAAYQVLHNGKKITFLDTPGHAAFGEMRARGANVTDIAVLVVAANDGVMPQTIEALNHARAAGVPIVVAMNKCDLPDRNEQRVLTDLASHELLVADYGGDTEVVRTSGLTGAGLEDLLETLLTVAELKELTADASRPAHGVCLEAFRDEGRGALAWFIVQDGTLRKGDIVLCGQAFGRIRSMYDDHDKEIEEATPSMPVKVAGLDIVPGAGDRFFVMKDYEEARTAAETRRQRGRELQLAQRGKIRSLQEILTSS
ncbi:MAG: translation initiation factor IF-2, partial [Planctomycetes bacterium]|nr:translation initiation factor IF-2 [Planctomycetota bacterium]